MAFWLMSTCLVTVSTLEADGPANWPQFRGPTGQGHAVDAALPIKWNETENVIWKRPLTGRGHSSPVIWGDQIWITTDSGGGTSLGAVCLQRETGEVLHDLVVFEPDAPKEIHADNTYASPTPVIEEGRLYVHYGRYGTACIDTTDGEILWRNLDLVIEHEGGPGSSPVLHEKLLIVNCDGADQQYVIALDTATGSEVWKQRRSAPQRANETFRRAFSTPLLFDHGGRTILLSTGADQTHAYDAATGEELWHVRYTGFSNVAAPTAGGEVSYLVTGFFGPEILAIRFGGAGNVSTSHLEWRYKGAVPETPSPLLVEDRLFLVANNGVASAVDVTTGKRVWLQRLGGNFSASPLTDGRHVYYCGRDGKTHVVSLGVQPEVIQVNQLDGALWASAAVSNNDLYLRTDAAIYRISANPGH